MKKKLITITIYEETIAKLKKTAIKEDRSEAYIARKAIVNYLS